MVTYQDELYVISDIFRTIVATVNQNITTDLTKSIKNVNFKHGTWQQVKAELIKDSQAQDFDASKYPAIVLLHRVDEEITSDSTFKFDVLIVCKSSKDLRNDKRVADSFKPILNVICAELISVMRSSRFFSGYNSLLKFNKIDLFHVSDGGNGNTYNLPDVLDGVLLTNLELNVSNSGCYKLPIPTIGYTIGQLDIIGSLSISGQGDDSIVVTISNTLFKDNVGGKEAKYTMTFSTYTLDIEPNVDYSLYLFDVPDGIHKLSVVSILGSKVEAEVHVESGIILQMVNSATFSIDYNLNFYKSLLCNVTSGGSMTNTTFFEQSRIDHNGNTIGTVFDTSNYNMEEESTLVLSNTFEIQSETEQGTELENKHIINLKQIL